MSLRINNETPYRSEDLRAWTLAALKHRGALNRHKIWRVTWKPSRSKVSGRAWINTGIFRMSIPSPARWRSHPDLWIRYVDQYRESLAYILLHEIDHCLGLPSGRSGEREMRGAFRADPKGFLKGFPDLPWPQLAERKPAKPKGKARALEIKLEEARERAKLYEKRERAALRLKRKWMGRVRYYEKRQAATKEDS